MPSLLLVPLAVTISLTLIGPLQLQAIGGDCPLDFSWSNFTSAAAACSPSSVGRPADCCRHLNSFVAIAVARYANSSGDLGVPPALSDTCLSFVSGTFSLHGIPPAAAASCGLGSKIPVTYHCGGGPVTILEMTRSPSFDGVVQSCSGGPLSLDGSCRMCLNAGIVFVHKLIGSTSGGGGDDDGNVAVSVCRNAVFVALANVIAGSSVYDMAACFFGVQSLMSGPASRSYSEPILPSSPAVTASEELPLKSAGVIPPHQRRPPFHLSLVSGVGIGIILVSITLLLILALLIRKKTREFASAEFAATTGPLISAGPSLPPAVFRRYSLEELRHGTGDFGAVIGRGGFGTVFKAEFNSDGGSLAAVKRMDKVAKQGEEEFCRELELLARLHHRHLVRLKGFCVDSDKRFLVYEYMANGSLKDHLQGRHGAKGSLSWRTRMQIAVDIANALEYLHFYCDPPLCHRDVKSSNILLDSNFVAKLADFGLAHAARTGAVTFEPVNTDVRGTPGYLDPEYVVKRELTEKSDVYSYGVVLLELLTGRRAVEEGKNLVEWSRIHTAAESHVEEIVDPEIRWAEDGVNGEQLRMLARLIRWCTQKEGRARPTVKQVLRMFAEVGSTEEQYVFRSGSGGGELRAAAAVEMSSSSTTRSCCSRSVLLEGGGSGGSS